jgi:hypothetical protein
MFGVEIGTCPGAVWHPISPQPWSSVRMITTFGGTELVMVNDFDVVWPPLSAADAVKVYVPALVAVPAKTPALFSKMPGGRDPAVMLHV